MSKLKKIQKPKININLEVINTVEDFLDLIEEMKKSVINLLRILIFQQ